MGGIAIGRLINLGKIIGSVGRKIGDREKLDDYETGICVDRWLHAMGA
tara:strand:- start:4070 stop:4213 length:144 start_codon:yes stop_codon:yes gene_type:complete